MAKRCNTKTGCSYPRGNWWKQTLGTDYFSNSQGVTYSDELQAVLDYASTQGWTAPSDADKLKYDTFFQGLVDDGIWAVLDYGVIFVKSGDANFKCINIKSPGSNQGTRVNSPTVNENGLTGNGTSSYLDTNFNVSTHSAQATQNSNAYAIGVATNSAAASTTVFGYENTGNYTGIFTRLAGDLVNSRQNCGGSDQISVANANRIGRYCGYRTSSTSISLDKNNSLLGSDTSANSVAFPSGDFFIGCRNDMAGAGAELFSPDTIQYFFWGNFGSLRSQLDARLVTFLS